MRDSGALVYYVPGRDIIASKDLTLPSHLEGFPKSGYS